MRLYRDTFIWTLTWLFALTLWVVVPASAQVTTGDITGRVTDSQQRVVAGATVAATNKGTRQVRSTTTNEGGDFSLSELTPGRYDVTVEAPSFSKSVVRDYEVNVGSTRTLNIEMKPGEVTAVVEVTADALALETTKSEIGGVVTPVEVQNLPLLNRTFAALSVIMPEARPVGNFDPTKTRVGNVAFNGGDGRQVDVNVDGGDNKDNVVGSLLQNFSYESIQEFQVLQHRWT
ncbi:MAG: carboxypeptidase-like regulatory domain-containing protein, partial [Pyrinomonadaceae bacterium]